MAENYCSVNCDYLGVMVIDRSIRSEIVAIRGMMLGIPMPNASLDLTHEVEAALIG